MLTTAGKLAAKAVIHTVKPAWNDGDSKEEKLLENAYRNSLTVAKENSYKTICFFSISTGAYRFPSGKAAEIDLKTIKDLIIENGQFEESA